MLMQTQPGKVSRMKTPGVCLNTAGCALARRGRRVMVELKQPFVCPGCGAPLSPPVVKEGSTDRGSCRFWRGSRSGYCGAGVPAAERQVTTAGAEAASAGPIGGQARASAATTGRTRTLDRGLLQPCRADHRRHHHAAARSRSRPAALPQAATHRPVLRAPPPQVPRHPARAPQPSPRRRPARRL